MQPILNLSPGIYEAIIAAFALVSVFAVFALRRKHQQAEKLKSTVKDVVTQATVAFFTSQMIASLRVAAAKNETRKIANAADKALNAASSVIDELTEQVEELREESQESRLDDLEETVGELVAEHNERETAPTVRGRPFNLDIESRSPFGTPDPFASLRAAGFSPTGRRLDTLDPLSALLGSLGRNTGRGGPSVQAFKITPRGLEPVNGPADFGLPDVSTFNRPTPGGERATSLADILSLLASLPTPPRRGPSDPFSVIFGGSPADSIKADLSGKPGEFLYDEHGPAAPGDALTEGAGLGGPATVEAEACDTQRPGRTYDETHTAAGDRCEAGDPAAIAPAAPAVSVAGGAESPANDPGARATPERRVPRYSRDRDDGFNSQSPRAG